MSGISENVSVQIRKREGGVKFLFGMMHEAYGIL